MTKQVPEARGAGFIQDGVRCCGWCVAVGRTHVELPLEPGAECEDCGAVVQPDGEWEWECIDCGGIAHDQIAAGPICNECFDRREWEAQELEARERARDREEDMQVERHLEQRPGATRWDPALRCWVSKAELR